MTTETIDTAAPTPIIPVLEPLYQKLAPFGAPLIRVSAGLMLMPHGAQKLFGWFGGYGLEGTAGFFAGDLGLEPGIFWAALVASTEFFGGLSICWVPAWVRSAKNANSHLPHAPMWTTTWRRLGEVRCSHR